MRNIFLFIYLFHIVVHCSAQSLGYSIIARPSFRDSLIIENDMISHHIIKYGGHQRQNGDTTFYYKIFPTTDLDTVSLPETIRAYAISHTQQDSLLYRIKPTAKTNICDVKMIKERILNKDTLVRMSWESLNKKKNKIEKHQAFLPCVLLEIKMYSECGRILAIKQYFISDEIDEIEEGGLYVINEYNEGGKLVKYYSPDEKNVSNASQSRIRKIISSNIMSAYPFRDSLRIENDLLFYDIFIDKGSYGTICYKILPYTVKDTFPLPERVAVFIAGQTQYDSLRYRLTVIKQIKTGLPVYCDQSESLYKATCLQEDSLVLISWQKINKLGTKFKDNYQWCHCSWYQIKTYTKEGKLITDTKWIIPQSRYQNHKKYQNLPRILRHDITYFYTPTNSKQVFYAGIEWNELSPKHLHKIKKRYPKFTTTEKDGMWE